MAIMLPSYLSGTIQSQAEKQIFGWFKEDNNTKDWFVLHSVGLAQHKRHIYGEIDFIVLAPGYGFFCLEVKGGRVSVKDGIWSFTDRNNNTDTSTRGPFKQAEEGFFSIRNYLKSKLPIEKQKVLRCVAGIGVMFPDIFYHSVGSEDDKELVFDSSFDGDVFSYITQLASYTENKMRDKGLSPYRPTTDDILAVKNAIRGDYSFDFSAIANKHLSLEKMKEITEQQTTALALLNENNHCLFYGHAGTGKTFLAIETATRFQSKGLKVGFFCYNKALANWLSKVMSDEETKPFYIGTVHSYAVHIIGSEETEISDWKQLVSDCIMQLDSSQKEVFDVIVLDEAQDLTSPTYYLFFSKLLKGGLTNGRFYVFGDFVSQNIYESDIPDFEKLNLLSLATRDLVRYPLTLNCRNTMSIHKLVAYAYNISEKEWKSANIEGPNYEYIPKDSLKLITVINQLLDNGVHPKCITILSPYIASNSTTYQTLVSNSRIRKAFEGEDSIVYSTIKAYKGLENDYVFVCDVSENNFDETLYVALTRARYALYVVGDQKLLVRMLKING